MSGNSSVGHGCCPLCGKEIADSDDFNILSEKGVKGLNDHSARRGSDIVVEVGQRVHVKCRKQFTREKSNKGKETNVNERKRSSRSLDGQYNNEADCLFCGTQVDRERLALGSDYHCVRTDVISETLMGVCERRADTWSFVVRGRIEYYAKDLHAADCLYHHSCSCNFRSGLNVPMQYRAEPVEKKRKSGRPKNEDQEQAFQQMCSYLEENDEEQLTLSDLSAKMTDFLQDSGAPPYGTQYLKAQLQKRYGDMIVIAEGEGLRDIITMREKTSQILRSHFQTNRQGDDEETQKREIIRTAARLIKSDIKSSVPSVTDNYPTVDEFKLGPAYVYLPEALRLLLQKLFVGKNPCRKIASIGQAIIQAVRPRAVVAPLQVGLAVQAHHLYRSRFLNDTLNEMGFGSSYSEVQRFQKNAADSVAPDPICSSDVDLLGITVMFAADNVDHNVITLDGKGTFHGMGMIAALTPGRKVSRVIPRKHPSQINLSEKTKIELIEYRFASKCCKDIVFEELPNVQVECYQRIDVLWELSFHFRQTTPSWQGMMHILHQDKEHPGQSSVVYLPMIDMYSGDKTCILSTLEYISDLAYKHHIPPVITFDQPLYWKACEIISEPRNSHLKTIVLMLGSFHTFMNVLGAIGTLMAGTGLDNILGEVYGENAIVHMMSGKAVQRAFRGHLLVTKCLNKMVISDLVAEQPELSSIVTEAEDIYTSLVKGEISIESAETSEALVQMSQAIESKKTNHCERSKTSQLWVNYQEMVQLATTLVKSDRSGNWKMHLQAVSDCLPIFAASGHFNYLKSAYYYLQQMKQLETSHPEVFSMFQKGFHVIRRTNQFWAGLSPDLVIEQSLMRSLKTSGGLTRGSGITESQRSLWTMSTPITSEYNLAMQEFNDLSYTTSEQHKEATQARLERDSTDLQKILTKLVTYSPFSDDPTLRNIVNGVVAGPDVNVHEFKSVGKTIIEKMVGLPVFSISFKRKDKAKTLGSTNCVKVAQDRTIDPGLLFQRFLLVSKTGDLSLEDVMKHELSPFPPALFEDRKVLRKADKPQLAHAILDFAQKASAQQAEDDNPPKTEHYVLDGGSLLQRLQWKRGETYGSIAESYADFTVKRFPSATVVFDGYPDGPTIKDNTHRRRGMNIHPIVRFTEETIFTGKKEDFLSRDRNKQTMINLISERLRQVGCEVVNAPDDADVEIVKAAVRSAETKTTTLIGEDTDLLVLLLYHTKQNSKDLYFRSDKANASALYHINQLQAVLGEKLCNQLLFLHSYTGCDTTSRIFGVGKKGVFHKMAANSELNTCADVFLVPKQSKAVIENSGCRAMTLIFGSKSSESLATLRYSNFSKKVVSSHTFVAPERLPPTAASTKFHSYRAYYQTMVWMGCESDMNPCEWGWKLEEDQYVPVGTDMNAAPDNLLKIIHCNCTSGCGSSRCSCRRYGLPCTPACGPCQVDSCDNPHNQTLVDDNDEDP